MNLTLLGLTLLALQKQPNFFTTPLTLEEMKGKQVVVETAWGSFVDLKRVRVEKKQH
jgi:hypothetical protein